MMKSGKTRGAKIGATKPAAQFKGKRSATTATTRTQPRRTAK